MESTGIGLTVPSSAGRAWRGPRRWSPARARSTRWCQPARLRSAPRFRAPATGRLEPAPRSGSSRRTEGRCSRCRRGTRRPPRSATVIAPTSVGFEANGADRPALTAPHLPTPLGVRTGAVARRGRGRGGAGTGAPVAAAGSGSRAGRARARADEEVEQVPALSASAGVVEAWRRRGVLAPSAPSLDESPEARAPRGALRGRPCPRS